MPHSDPDSPSSSSSPPTPVESAKTTRTLVLCFDGSSSMYDSDNTNVVKFFSLLKKDDENTQMCYYQPGIGTFINPGAVSPLFTWGAKILDLAVAWYLDAHVMGGYTYLMENWRLGDNVCIFGFSRGAYTARALAGFLYKIGLLPRSNIEQIPFAYKLYTRTDEEGVALSAGFKKTFCRKVDVKFLGVWDTVSSVGVVMARTLPFTNSNSSIETFRHALSLDEHRSKFRPNFYHRPAPDEEGAKLDPEHGSPIQDPPTNSTSDRPRDSIAKALSDDHADNQTAGQPSTRPSKGKTSLARKPSSVVKNLLSKNKRVKKWTENVIGVIEGLRDEQEEENERPPTNVLEVWFSGCHSDVGGGSVLDTTEHLLGSISLRWMVREVMSSQCGIQFDHAALKRLGMDGSSSSPLFAPKAIRTLSGVEESRHALDALDATAPIHDSLSFRGWNWEAPWWWLLEIIPSTFRWQDNEGVWHKNFSFHLGRGRDIKDDKPNFHRTVKQRMGDVALKYKPKAKWAAGSEVYVE